MAETAFTVTERRAGSQTNSATVSFERDRIVVDGTIWGTDGSKTAELTGTAYDSDTDALTITVGTTAMPDAGDMSIQAIMEIAYRAVVTAEGGLPDRVTVTHDNGDGPTEVTTATR